MAKQLNGPRPMTRLGLASDVRATDYQTRVKSSARRGLKSRSAAKPTRTGKHKQGQGGRDR